MAKVTMKQKRRYRVQISISNVLWEKYNRNLVLAKQLGAEIDFSKDFDPWFAKQNDQVSLDLQELQKGREAEATVCDKKGGKPHVSR